MKSLYGSTLEFSQIFGLSAVTQQQPLPPGSITQLQQYCLDCLLPAKTAQIPPLNQNKEASRIDSAREIQILPSLAYNVTENGLFDISVWQMKKEGKEEN